MSSLEKLKQAFIEQLAVDPGVDFDGLAYGKTQGWDSVAHMSLVAAIEEQFDVMLATEEVIDLSSFGKAREILAANHGVSF